MIDLKELRTLADELADEGCQEEAVLVHMAADKIEILCAQLKQAREHQDKMRDLLNAILNINQEFRDTMPENWEGDPLQDACDEARAYLNAAITGDEMVQATTADVQPGCDHPVGVVAQLAIMVPQPHLDRKMVAEAVAKALLTHGTEQGRITLVLPDDFAKPQDEAK